MANAFASQADLADKPITFTADRATERELAEEVHGAIDAIGLAPRFERLA